MEAVKATLVIFLLPDVSHSDLYEVISHCFPEETSINGGWRALHKYCSPHPIFQLDNSRRYYLAFQISKKNQITLAITVTLIIQPGNKKSVGKMEMFDFQE